MISEPEMAGEIGAVETPEIVSDLDRRPTGPRGSRSPWLWALGGMVAASALWAAAVFHYGLGSPRPDARGYHLNHDPCPSMKLASIESAITPRDSAGLTDSGLLKDPALDQVQCFVSLQPETNAKQSKPGWFLYYTVGITVEQHKKADPRAEFEARRRVTDLGVVPEDSVKVVTHLGDKAYLVTRSLGDTELRVVDGGTVLSLHLSAVPHYEGDGTGDQIGDGPDTPDLSSYQQAMINDMRDLMASLKR
jgi:hypothetical protein